MQSWQECTTTVTCSAGAIAEQNVNDVFNDLHIKVHDPMGNEILTKDIDNWTDNGPDDTSSDINQLGHVFKFKVDKPGTYMVWAKFTDEQVVVAEVHVSVFVLPESPIGALALIGATAVVLGEFAYRKQTIRNL